jgi:hypothetical protein
VERAKRKTGLFYEGFYYDRTGILFRRQIFTERDTFDKREYDYVHANCVVMAAINFMSHKIYWINQHRIGLNSA